MLFKPNEFDRADEAIKFCKTTAESFLHHAQHSSFLVVQEHFTELAKQQNWIADKLQQTLDEAQQSQRDTLPSLEPLDWHPTLTATNCACCHSPKLDCVLVIPAGAATVSDYKIALCDPCTTPWLDGNARDRRSAGDSRNISDSLAA